MAPFEPAPQDGFVNAIASLVGDPHQYISPVDDDISLITTKVDERLTLDSLERFKATPRRARGRTVVWDLPSFEIIVGGRDAIVFASDETKRFTAVFNYDGWRDHTAAYQLKTTTEWDLWAANNGTLMTQSNFAEFLEDASVAVVEPSAADLMQISQTFRAKRNASFESGVRLQSGDVKFVYQEETKATAGKKGELDIPEIFTLRLPVFQGGGLVEVTARLRYRIEDSGLRIGYRIPRLEDYKRDAFNALMGEVRAGLSAPAQQLVYGPAPEPLQQL